jgi:hypothetical protein
MRIAILTNAPAPYRTAVFERIAVEHRNDRKIPPGLVRVRCLPGAAEMSSREEIKLLKKRLPPRNWLRICWTPSGASALAIGLSRAWESPNPKNMR